MKRLILPFLLAPFLALADGGLPNQPYIYVKGEAELEKPADMVTLTFQVSARDIDQTKANKQVQAQAGKVLALLNDSKIPEKDVEASDITSQPQYDTEEGSRRTGKFLGYQVTRPMSVVVRDLQKYPKLLDDLFALRITEFSGVAVGLANSKELTDEIGAKAVAKAREEAEKTLAGTGMRISSVFAISPVAFPEISSNIFQEDHAAAMTVAAAQSAPEYRLAPVTVSQSVHVIYLIVPEK